MAGLLDFVNTPEGQGLLSAAFGGLAGARRGQPLNSIGRGGLAGLAGYAQAQDRELQLAENAFNKQYKTAQMTKLEQEIQANKARTDFLTQLQGGPTQALTQGSQVGDVGPTVTNAKRLDALIPPGLQKIPQSAIQADVALNGGKNIAEWMFKTGVPDMNVSGGYAYDKNNTPPGYLPQLSVSNDGKATLVTIDPKTGMPTVSAPTGAVQTYGAYRGVEEGTKADYDAMPVTLPNGTTVMTTRKAMVEGARPSPARPSGNYSGNGYAGGSSAAAATDQRAILMRERESAVASGRTQDVAALDRELARLPGGAQVPGVSQVPGIQVQGDAEKLAATEKVKNDAATAAAIQKDRKTARKFLNVAKEAESLLLKDPTGSLGGSFKDQVLGAFGMTTDAANTAQSLKAVSGWLVSNTPRMEGPQSNFDVANYQTMAADVGNDKLPVERRLFALRQVMSMLNEVNGEDQGQNTPKTRKIVRTGMYGGKKVVQYDDGSTEYAN